MEFFRAQKKQEVLSSAALAGNELPKLVGGLRQRGKTQQCTSLRKCGVWRIVKQQQGSFCRINLIIGQEHHCSTILYDHSHHGGSVLWQCQGKKGSLS